MDPADANLLGPERAAFASCVCFALPFGSVVLRLAACCLLAGTCLRLRCVLCVSFASLDSRGPSPKFTSSNAPDALLVGRPLLPDGLSISLLSSVSLSEIVPASEIRRHPSSAPAPPTDQEGHRKDLDPLAMSEGEGDLESLLSPSPTVADGMGLSLTFYMRITQAVEHS
jgi:hypothetical protein